MAYSPVTKRGLVQLAQAESIIERGLSTFMGVGKALEVIRDGKLYRDAHSTFEDYCQDRWGMSRRRANQLVDAAQMGTMVPKLKNERQARALKEADDPQEVYAEAETRGDTTSTGIAAVVAESKAPSGSDQPAPAGAAGPGDDEREEFPAPSPAPKVAPTGTATDRLTIVCPTCAGSGLVEAGAA